VAAALVLELVEYHMHLDADRDGRVDDDYSGLDVWEWGLGKKGAVILCNNDDDDHRTPSRSDNDDDEVNGGNDVDELAPLVLRRVGPAAPPTWEAILEIDPADVDKIRIFDRRVARSKEIIGPSAGHRYRFPGLDFSEREFGMEALRYAGTGFDGEIMLTFSVKTGTGHAIPPQNARVRVAPWMMPNHLDRAETVYVVDDGRRNQRFRRELGRYVAAAGCDLQEHPNQDIWMQDCMEWGYSSLPTGVGFRTVIQAPRRRPLGAFPSTLLQPDLGYYQRWNPTLSTLNSFGNLEVSPPVTSKAGKEYPWGRIYYGHSTDETIIDRDLEEFLKAQKVQEPVAIDTSWLFVKHVDEIMSFVPSSRGAKGFKLLLASPGLAYKILNYNRARHPSGKMLTGRGYSHTVKGIEADVTIEDFFNDGLISLDTRFTSNHLESYNRAKQSDIARIRKDVLEIEFGVDDSDIIEVPVIFADIEETGFADALTANMVNMLVINRHCIFPKPYGPLVGSNDLFQVELEQKLEAEGLIPCPIDDWYEYHVNLGEVHCGTNTLRMPTFAKWWEFKR
jgi:protein-arginine deiminase